ncbi:hypothetical protein DOTSEDRAFT_83917 [Dothistroma septosporum NZE10]|uniref:Uncharacterized protein n=1 Tax=Dothistroma septosporum (strain NZE10 / CBS 128990) TaxID=675120 RepID=N1PDR9_DOTSN|nr:hypothetical protein DOTSEDRAFT_83917 [Dothistroma septosporum NZE10]
MESETYSLPILRKLDLLGIAITILFLFSTIACFIYKVISVSAGPPQCPRPIELDSTIPSHPYEDDSGYDSSDDDDVDGLGHLRKALQMVDDTFGPKLSSARRHADDFQVFANFASVSQRRGMHGEEAED